MPLHVREIADDNTAQTLGINAMDVIEATWKQGFISAGSSTKRKAL